MFTLGGRTAKDLGLIMLRSAQRPVLPGTRDSSVSVPGRPGAYDFGGELGPREFEIECGIIATNRVELQSIVRDLAAHLIGPDGRPRALMLTFDVEPGKTYTVRYSGDLPIERILRTGRVTLPLVAHDPHAYGPEDEESFVADAVTVDNQGAVETPPTFVATFSATVSEWKVTLGTDYIRVVHDFQAGDTLEINCATGAVLINGSRALDKLDWQNSVFFALPPEESILEILPTGVCTASVIFKPRWL